MKESTLLEMKNKIEAVFDILGREVLTLVNERQKPGRYAVTFDAKKLVSSVYFYKLQAGSDFVDVKKMLLLR